MIASRIPLLLGALLGFGGCVSRETASWRIVDAGPFTFEAPADMRATKPEREMESHVGEFRSRYMHLKFNCGPFSDDMSTWPASTTFEPVVIDGKAAKIGTVIYDSNHHLPYLTAVYVRNVRPPASDPLLQTHLSVTASSQTAAGVPLAQRIFRSIRFKRSRK